MRFLVIILILCCESDLYSQVIQSHRFELEYKNRDDYVNVLPVSDQGVMIFRDTDDYNDGDVWNVIALDTTLTEKWNIELSIDSKYVFKGYEVADSKLYILFREGEFEKKDYHLMAISFENGAIERYDIENEIGLELSHMSMLSTGLVLGGYINFSPALVLYTFGSKSFEVVPGYFKDKSTLVDLSDNQNSTLNAITLESDYEGNFLRLRTYSYDGDLFFEREVEFKEDVRILSAKSSGFIDGNVVIGGTYGLKKSSYASGFYVTVVKPAGQKNIVKYHNFYDLEHFFEYMSPKRAARLQKNMENRSLRGKEVNFPSRINLNTVQKTKKGYLFLAELFNPKYNNNSLNSFGYLTREENLTRVNSNSQNYARVPNSLQKVDDADTFEYKESIIFEVNRFGELLWDNSMKIEKVELQELKKIVPISVGDYGVKMIYQSEEQLAYKKIKQNRIEEEGMVPIEAKFEYDEVLSTISGIGASSYWYDSNFFIWGYQKIENKFRAVTDNLEKNRYVLYINKVAF